MSELQQVRELFPAPMIQAANTSFVQVVVMWVQALALFNAHFMLLVFACDSCRSSSPLPIMYISVPSSLFPVL